MVARIATSIKDVDVYLFYLVPTSGATANDLIFQRWEL